MFVLINKCKNTLPNINMVYLITLNFKTFSTFTHIELIHKCARNVFFFFLSN